MGRSIPTTHIVAKILKETKVNHLMIDLETLSLKNNPIIASIGIAIINSELTGILASDEVSIDLKSCEAAGLHLDLETLLWWMNQGEEVRSHTFKNQGAPLEKALRELNTVYTEYKCEKVWGNGSAEDLIWLQSAYEAVGLSPAWTYKDRMCYRTLRTVFPVELKRDPELLPHVAEHDAVYQAQHLIVIMKNLKETKNGTK